MKINKYLITCLVMLGLASPILLSANSKEVKAADYFANVDTSTASNLFNSLKTITNNAYKNQCGYSNLKNWYKTTDIRSDGKVNDMYSNITNYTISDAGSSASSEGGGWNKEHTIPKSYWGGSTSNQGCDIFLVYPTDIYINSMRSNYPFGEVGSISKASKNNYSKLGTSKFAGYNGTVFEPNDEWKGDMARAYFYACVKWEGYKFTQSSGNISFSGSVSKNFGLTDYMKNLMVKWHDQDPVSAFESSRNEKAKALQGNYNPFINHPEYVDIIWGGTSTGGGTGDNPQPTDTTNYGTEDAPLSVSEAYSVISSQCTSDNSRTNKPLYVLGEIKSMDGIPEGKSYYQNVVVTDGTKDILIYTLNSTEELEVGDKILFTGFAKNYKGTLEFATNGTTYVTVLSVNAGGNPPTPPTPQETDYGTEDEPLTTSEAYTLISEECLEDGDKTQEALYVLGEIKSMDGIPEGKSYYQNVVVTDGTKDILIYTLNSTEELEVGDKILFTGYAKNYKGTLEFATNGTTYVTVLSINAGGNPPTPPTPQETDYGTEDEPLTVSEAYTLISEECLEDGDKTQEALYVLGEIKSMDGIPEGKSYYQNVVVTDGTKDILIYTLNSTEELEVGDEILFTGFAKNYKGTLEFATNGTTYVVVISVNAGGNPPTPPTPQEANYGTEEKPLNVTEALALATKECVNDGETTKQVVYCSGEVVSIGEATSYGYKNVTIKTGNSQILIYTLNSADEIKVGDTVVISGYIKNYQGTIEFATLGNEYVCLLSSTHGSGWDNPGPGPEPGPGPIISCNSAIGAMSIIAMFAALSSILVIVKLRKKENN